VIGGTWTSISINGQNISLTVPPPMFHAETGDVVVFTYTAVLTAVKTQALPQ